MELAVGFSATCASCWAELFTCARTHCELTCALSPGGNSCSSCVANSCYAGTVDCTGVPSWAFLDS
jgi:hypothetical protein